MDLKTGKTRTISRIASADPKYPFNAIGFNPKDNYLYGTKHKHLLRLFGDGRTEEVLQLPIQPNMGDFDEHGKYWCSNGGKVWASVDLDPQSRTYKKVESGKATFPGPKADRAFPSDWAYTPVASGHLYGVGVLHDKGRSYPALVRWSTTSKAWSVIYKAKNFKDARSFGAVMSTRNGIIYGLETTSGNIVRFDLYDHTKSTEMRGGPVSRNKPSHTYGTRCLLQPDSR
ncbi:hypothetical protein HRG_001723 [Hirsutella rhossiliensis]|uniref:DUF6923 domain-containing protein n=1 Tax=Hirsutella rhossiliensis TaxID=111463 RepID=A0A9P8N5U0_9HYPO|nr:uncharacterized protein HRG_01723 [Hirsutella rhossiliensis]KAH0966314.1 hypothetical protein HRG_01723 [Hirsutella rhossiliensis]